MGSFKDYDDLIYELRQRGLTTKQIQEHLLDTKGIKRCLATIGNRCNIIYAQRGKEQPKSIRRRGSTIQIPEETIYKLKKTMSYEEMTSYLNDNGYKVSHSTVIKRCREVYAKKGEEIPKVGKINYSSKVKQDIYNLIKQGKTYKEISIIFLQRGIKISNEMVSKIYKEKCKETGENPKLRARKGPTDEEIIEARENGMTIYQMERLFEEEGKGIHYATIYNKLVKLADQGKIDPKYVKMEIDYTEIDEIIFEQREKGKSYYRIKTALAERGHYISHSTIRKRCKIIYSQKGIPEPKTKINRKKIKGQPFTQKEQTRSNDENMSGKKGEPSELRILDERLETLTDKKKASRELLEKALKRKKEKENGVLGKALGEEK